MKCPMHFFLLALSLAAPLTVQSASLLSMMQSASNISTFVRLLNETGLAAQMSSGTCDLFRCYLVFAPTNSAFQAAYPDGLSKLTIADKKLIVNSLYISKYPTGKGLLANWQAAGTPQGIDVGFGQVQILQPSSGVLYWPRRQVTTDTYMYHVNSARIINAESNKEADNGVYHVLDEVPLPFGDWNSLSSFISSIDSSPNPAIARLKITKSLRYFKAWMNNDTEKNVYYSALERDTIYKVRTLFLPSDQAWNVIGADGLAVLDGSLETRRQLLAAHFAMNYTLFTGWLSDNTKLNFTCGVTALKELPAEMYIDGTQRASVSAGGVVAKLLDRAVNFPLSDTVIHVIDRPLGFLYRNLAVLARDHAPAFYSACDAVASCKAMLHSNTTNYTLFAPLSIDSVRNLAGSELERVLHLHFVPDQRIIRSQMSESMLLQSASNSGHIRFSMMNNNTNISVEGRLTNRGYVRALLRQSDEAATNGMLHVIANPLGQPDKNVQELINSLPLLSNVSQYLGRNGFDPALNSPTMMVTAFAPINTAMDKMRQYRNSRSEAIGQQILSNQNLMDRVLRRMLVPSQRVQASTLNAGSYQYATANTVENERITLTLSGSAAANNRDITITGASVTANVNKHHGPYEATNGIVYQADSVLFRDADTSGYTSAANGLRVSPAVYLLPLLLLQLLRFCL